MLKKVICALLGLSMTAVAMCGCSVTSIVNSVTTNFANINSPDEPEFILKESDDQALAQMKAAQWSDFTFSIDGTVVELPTAFKVLEENGWVFDDIDFGREQDFVLNQGDKVLDVSLFNNGEKADIGIVNLGVETCDVPAGSVWSFSVDITEAEIKPDVILPGGITWGADVDRIKEVYGNPTGKAKYSKSLECWFYEYKNDNLNNLKLVVYDDGGLKSFEYSVYAVEDDTETDIDTDTEIDE